MSRETHFPPESREPTSLWVPEAKEAGTGFQTTHSDLIGIAVARDSALNHTYQVAHPAFERLVDTAVGPITVIRQDTPSLDYSAHDLAELLTSRNRNDLTKLEDRAGDRPVSIPGNPDIILRWDAAGALNRIPDIPRETAAHAEKFEQQIARLRQKGLPLLNRNVFIVEQDEYNNGKPTIYTAVERHDVPPLCTAEQASWHTPLTGDMDTHLWLCGLVADYLIETPPGTPYIADSLEGPHQFSQDGLLFDYGQNIGESIDKRSYSLQMVLNGWADRLPPSSGKNDILDRIEEVPWLYDRPFGDN